MEGLVKGDVVVVPFPFSDLSQAKRRPALVVARVEGGDLILCQITSQPLYDRYSVALRESDFQTGGLRRESRARPNRLFTADVGLVLYRAGHVKGERLHDAVNQIVEILRNP